MRHHIELARMLIGTIFAALLTLPGVEVRAIAHGNTALFSGVRMADRSRWPSCHGLRWGGGQDEDIEELSTQHALESPAPLR